ncbi:MAG: caspase family protein [Rhizobacter sp.]|nr:caspase family protein [Ferruginibacter sp.]
MLSLQSEFKELSEDSKFRLDAFYRRFCQGNLGRHYGLGHLVYACHASFPLMLSPDLANLIWINFKNYYFNEKNVPAQVQPIAVSDFLLSPLCREAGFKRYEVYPEIRSFLLMLLKDGKWFEIYGIRKEGKTRLTDLAQFLREYLTRKVPENKYDGAAFRQLNDWAVMAWLDPKQLATEIARTFEGNSKIKNEKAQLWLSLQLDKVGLQYDRNVNFSNDKKDLNSFYRIFYYGKARKEELKNKNEEAIYEYAKEIRRFVDIGELKNEIKIPLPLLKSAAERTERKISDVQRIIGLFIGVNDYKDENIKSLQSSKSSVEKMISLLQACFSSTEAINKVIFEQVILIDEAATLAAIMSTLTDVYKKANDEDIVLFFFSGHSARQPGANLLICYDTERSRINTTAFSNSDFNDIITKSGKNPQSVIILDTETGYYDWGKKDDVFIGATNNTSQAELVRPESSTFFMQGIFELLNKLNDNFTYKDLFLILKHRSDELPPSVGEERPVVRIPKTDYQGFFLSKRRSTSADYPILVYNVRYGSWEVVEEDYKILSLNHNTEVFDYKMNTVSNARGEIFIDRENNFLAFNGSIANLQSGNIYRIKPSRDSLSYGIAFDDDLAPIEVSAISLITDIIKNIEFDSYSKWGRLELFTDHPQNATLPQTLPYTEDDYLSEFSRHSAVACLLIKPVKKNRANYQLSFHEKLLNETVSKILVLHVDNEKELEAAIIKLARYNYLFHLQLPVTDYVRHEPLNVAYRWYWNLENHEGNEVDGENILFLTDECIRIEGDEIIYYPFSVAITNNEYFAIFFEIYMLVSDISIKNVSPASISKIEPGETITVTINEQSMLERMLIEDGDVSVKLLLGRDPIRVSFEQTP